jgi:hypothetical protein
LRHLEAEGLVQLKPGKGYQTQVRLCRVQRRLTSGRRKANGRG